MNCNERIKLINLQLFAQEEKTEEATPHKQQETRKKGQVAKSTDLNAALGIFVLVLTLFWIRGYYGEKLSGFVVHIYSQELVKELSHGQLIYILKLFMITFFEIAAPIFVISVIIGISSNMLQVGFKITPEAIKPKLSHLNPIEGFKRIFSKKALVEMAKAIIKVIVVGMAVFLIVKSDFDKMLFMVDMGMEGISHLVANVMFKVAIVAASVFIFVAILDILYQKWEFKQRIKMTKHEVKQEYKQTEGDPLIKSKVREKQRKMAMSRMMTQVPEATVVVTNPTHLAIALKYEDGVTDAPLVLAKGAGYVALKIIDLAKENSVPIIENKPAAWSLYESVEIGQVIPFELYQLVAEILAAVYRLKNKGRVL
ncbi:flagellar biosynthesis protein FlhB [Desulfitibacter alkalitolerans]|uniref:flagellar biosynthesis protein FlhB n=1 Tax=Desulfitibacter alkalitolerans TaxID=264641 RepID=UPI000686AF83|nr:flagellar biosynthesis protein FlhB [Desulfitibacter alkalitolerans]